MTRPYGYDHQADPGPYTADDLPLNHQEFRQLRHRRQWYALRITDVILPAFCDVEDAYTIERLLPQIPVAIGLDADPETVPRYRGGRVLAKIDDLLGRRFS